MTAAFIAILLLTAFGLPLAMALHADAPAGMRAGEAFFLGCGWTTTVMLALSAADVPWSILSVLAGATVPLFLVVPLALRRSPQPAPVAEVNRTMPSRAIDLLTIVLIAGYTLYSTLGSMWERDFWGIFGAKARAFFDHGGVDWAFLTSPHHGYTHPDYPLGLPLLFDFAAVLNGEWDDRWIGLYFPMFTIALLLVTRPVIRRETRSSTIAAATGLMIAALSLTMTPGTAEAPLITLSAAALILLRDALNRDDAAMLRMAAVLLGIASLTKNEGAAMVVSAAAGTALATRSWRRTARLWPAAACAIGWIVTARSLGFQAAYLRSDSLLDRLIGHLAQSGEIVAQLATTPPAHALFWLACLSLLALSIPSALNERLLLTFVALQLTFYLAAYAVTPFPIAWQIQNSWARLLSHLAIPLAIAAVAAGLRWQSTPNLAEKSSRHSVAGKTVAAAEGATIRR